MARFTIVADNGMVCYKEALTADQAICDLVTELSGFTGDQACNALTKTVTDQHRSLPTGWRFEYPNGFGFKVSDSVGRTGR